jgi:Di-haem oxidoreductase, putative peroxidase
MIRTPLARIRYRLSLGVSGLLSLWAIWFVTPGVPVFRAPTASPMLRHAGLMLFEHHWQPADPLAGGDGLGPVFNDRSCVACHFQGGVGGGGDTKHNVLTFEVHPAPGRPDVQGGIVHAFSLSQGCRESRVGLHDVFRIVPGGLKIVGGCFVQTRDFDPVRTESINATALFGAGWVDRLSSKTIVHQDRMRSLQIIGKELLADLDSVPPGRVRVLPDGRIGKFGWKAQFATLGEFVAAACANELGLGTPIMEQARPFTHEKATKVEADLDQEQFDALVAFVDTLPRPVQILPSEPGAPVAIEHGRTLFERVGCAACHIPDLGGIAGVYSDFLLHRVSEKSGEGSGYSEVPVTPLPDGHPLPDEWKTPPLWGVADSAPYFHDGASPTLEAAISRHRGDAAVVTKAFEGLPATDRAAIVRFLKSLRAPSEAKPAPAEPRLRSHSYVAMSP